MATTLGAMMDPQQGQMPQQGLGSAVPINGLLRPNPGNTPVGLKDGQYAQSYLGPNSSGMPDPSGLKSTQRSPQQFAMDLRRAMMAKNKLMSISQLVENYGMPPSMVSKLLQGDSQDDNAGERADAANGMAGAPPSVYRQSPADEISSRYGEEPTDANLEARYGAPYDDRAQNWNEDYGYPLTDRTSRHPGHMSPDEADAYYDTPAGKARLKKMYGK